MKRTVVGTGWWMRGGCNGDGWREGGGKKRYLGEKLSSQC